jgi:hypothetical protein
MSLSETISPTQERLSKGDSFERPEISRTATRPAYRVRHPFEQMFRDGSINEGCLAAGLKLQRHAQGMHGANVSVSDTTRVAIDDPDGHGPEFASLRHGERIREARSWILERNTDSCIARWLAVLAVAEQVKTLEQIGREFRKYECRKMARAVGTEVISQALEDLAVLWKFSQAYHAKNPPSR